MIVGILICIFSFSIFEPESSWGEIYSILGCLLITAGIFRELRAMSLLKRILVGAGAFLLLIGSFIAADFVGVSEYKRPPVYRYSTITYFTKGKIIEYRNLFYHVFQINADTPNEYFIIDTKKEYGVDTVPVSPFNRDKCGISRLSGIRVITSETTAISGIYSMRCLCQSVDMYLRLIRRTVAQPSITIQQTGMEMKISIQKKD